MLIKDTSGLVRLRPSSSVRDDLSRQPDVDETSGEVDVSASGPHGGKIRGLSESFTDRTKHTVHHIRWFYCVYKILLKYTGNLRASLQTAN